MASPKSPGRMLRKDISRSKGFASLSDNAQVLFLMMIPHFNSHGKMNGSPHFIKGEVCPRIDRLTTNSIHKYLEEISGKTNVKLFTHDGLPYIHATNWDNHQDLRKDRIGEDILPDYSRTTPGGVPHEVEVEVEVEVKKKKTTSSPTPALDAPASEGVFLSDERGRTAFSDWERYRTEIKKRLSPSTRKAQLNVLDAIGVDRGVEMIRHTIEKGWIGLVDPGSNGGKTKPSGLSLTSQLNKIKKQEAANVAHG
jgi:hypothetical protein